MEMDRYGRKKPSVCFRCEETAGRPPFVEYKDVGGVVYVRSFSGEAGAVRRYRPNDSGGYVAEWTYGAWADAENLTDWVPADQTKEVDDASIA